MRKIFTLTVVVSCLLLAGTAQAGTLTSASWTGDFQGTPFTLTTGGGSLIAAGSSTGISASVAITVPQRTFQGGTFPLYITQNLGGSADIAITGGSATANAGIPGSIRFFVDVFPFLTIPLSVGGSGTSMLATTNAAVGAASATATFFPWTPGFVSISGLYGTTATPSGATNMTVPLPAFTAAGSFSLTVAGGGTITLVSPTITAVCAGSSVFAGPCTGSTFSSRTATATTLTLNFVPEPGTLLLLGAGLVGLGAVGRRLRS